jgi:hypothetical protein
LDVSDSVGLNSRLRWTFRPEADLFVVDNHNVRSLIDRWRGRMGRSVRLVAATLPHSL